MKITKIVCGVCIDRVCVLIVMLWFILWCLFFQVDCQDLCTPTIVNLRDAPCGNLTKKSYRGERFVPTGQKKYLPSSQCSLGSYTWLEFEGGFWGAQILFRTWLVNNGDENELNFASQLVGKQGWVLLIFPGVEKNSQHADPGWVNSLNMAYNLGMNVIVRLGPNWGNTHYRDSSDDPQHLVYKTLANAYKNVVQDLRLTTDNRNLYLQIDNEPDLCYEWYCGTKGSPLSYTEIASEYAHFLSDVIDALRTLENPKIKICAAGLAPGGCVQCGCCGEANCPGDKPGITSPQFLEAMSAAVPDIFSKIDFFCSHSYPAKALGWGFNVPYDDSIVGLRVYEQELQAIGKTDMEVLITETGWATHRDGLPSCTEQQKANWTVLAYEKVWMTDWRVKGVTPFMLMDGYWGDKCGYGYVNINRVDKYPVFGQVHDLRCRVANWTGGCLVDEKNFL